jgi:predicted DNA binding CopG/RHH family protein
MSEKQGKNNISQDIEEIAEQAEQGEDVSEHFSGQYSVKQRINIDFPLSLLKAIDAECQRIGVTRQAWIKMACDERLRQIQLAHSDLAA